MLCFPCLSPVSSGGRAALRCVSGWRSIRESQHGCTHGHGLRGACQRFQQRGLEPIGRDEDPAAIARRRRAVLWPHRLRQQDLCRGGRVCALAYRPNVDADARGAVLHHAHGTLRSCEDAAWRARLEPLWQDCRGRRHRVSRQHHCQPDRRRQGEFHGGRNTLTSPLPMSSPSP